MRDCWERRRGKVGGCGFGRVMMVVGPGWPVVVVGESLREDGEELPRALSSPWVM